MVSLRTFVVKLATSELHVCASSGCLTRVTSPPPVPRWPTHGHRWIFATNIRIMMNDLASSLDAHANLYHAPSDDRFIKPDGLHRARSDRLPNVQPMPSRQDSRLLLRKRSGHPLSQSIDLVQPILLPTAHPRHSYHHDPSDNVIIYAASLSPGDAVPSHRIDVIRKAAQGPDHKYGTVRLSY
jgi:hypothetical protein